MPGLTHHRRYLPAHTGRTGREGAGTLAALPAPASGCASAALRRSNACIAHTCSRTHALRNIVEFIGCGGSDPGAAQQLLGSGGLGGAPPAGDGTFFIVQEYAAGGSLKDCVVKQMYSPGKQVGCGEMPSAASVQPRQEGG